MFNKKDFEELRSKIEGLSEDILLLKKEQESQARTSHEKIQNEFSELKVRNDRFSSDMASELAAVSQLKEELQKSVRSFEQMYSKVYDSMYEKLNSILKDHGKELASTTERYKSLSPTVDKIVSDISSLKDEIAKFKAIASHIKATDFELEKHERNLEKHEWEKIKLLKRIDSLERMLGKMQRSRQ